MAENEILDVKNGKGYKPWRDMLADPEASSGDLAKCFVSCASNALNKKAKECDFPRLLDSNSGDLDNLMSLSKELKASGKHWELGELLRLAIQLTENADKEAVAKGIAQFLVKSLADKASRDLLGYSHLHEREVFRQLDRDVRRGLNACRPTLEKLLLGQKVSMSRPVRINPKPTAKQLAGHSLRRKSTSQSVRDDNV